MLLTRASEYALLSLYEVSRSDTPVGVDRLSQTLYIPKSFLAKILQNLAKAGILESKRGAKGGFVMAKEPKDIAMRDVIIAAEGKMPAVFDCTNYADTCPSGVIGSCTISPFLLKFQHQIDAFLADLTLEELLDG